VGSTERPTDDDWVEGAGRARPTRSRRSGVVTWRALYRRIVTPIVVEENVKPSVDIADAMP